MLFDTNDKPLTIGLSETPFLVKPDLPEVLNLTGINVTNHEDAKRAALHFLRMGVQHVAISIGSLGVLLASQNVILQATPPKMATHNVTGAGAAVMAGLAYGFSHNMPLNEIARCYASWSGRHLNGTFVFHDARGTASDAAARRSTHGQCDVTKVSSVPVRTNRTNISLSVSS